MLFVVDASRSMWQTIDGVPKIVHARQVLETLMRRLPADQPVGLIAYGHKDTQDCGNIEALVPLRNRDKGVIRDALYRLNPAGMTPLAQTAEKVVAMLEQESLSATVIFITDGMETCEGDICEVIQRARRRGIDMILHIVGFDMGKADQRPLICAARAGGGKYYEAKDQAGLALAIQRSSEAHLPASMGIIALHSTWKGTPTRSEVSVYRSGTRDRIGDAQGGTPPVPGLQLLKLPTGVYDLVVGLKDHPDLKPDLQTGLEVRRGDTTHIYLDFASGFLSLEVTAHHALHEALVKVHPHLDPIEMVAGRTDLLHNPWIVELPPGMYTVDIGSASIQGALATATLEQINIKPRDTTFLTHNFEPGTLSLGTRFQGRLCEGRLTILDPSSGRVLARRETASFEKTNPWELPISPGTYLIQAEALRLPGRPQTTQEVQVRPGERREVLFDW